MIPSKKSLGGALPYVFTEQSVAMVTTVFKSEEAILASIRIMNAFVNMRKFYAANQLIVDRIGSLEFKQTLTDKRIDKIFTALEQADPIPKQGIFFNGQIFDAYKFASDIIKSAKKSIILIDNYIDENTLALLSKRGKNVEAIVCSEKSNPILNNDFARFAEQYPPVKLLTLKTITTVFSLSIKKKCTISVLL